MLFPEPPSHQGQPAQLVTADHSLAEVVAQEWDPPPALCLSTHPRGCWDTRGQAPEASWAPLRVCIAPSPPWTVWSCDTLGAAWVRPLPHEYVSHVLLCVSLPLHVSESLCPSVSWVAHTATELTMSPNSFSPLRLHLFSPQGHQDPSLLRGTEEDWGPKQATRLCGMETPSGLSLGLPCWLGGAVDIHCPSWSPGVVSDIWAPGK